MSKNFTNILLFFGVTLSLIVSGCGSANSPTASSATDASQSTVYGVASLATTTDGTVSVKDSSTTPQEKTVAISSNGSYTADVSGLTAPFVLKASGTDQAGENNVLYSLSTNGGRANINQVSDTAVAAAAEDQDADRTILYSRFNHYEHHRTSDKFEEIIERLRTVLAPLFALYQVSGNPVTDDEGDDNEHSSSGLRALLRDVSFKVTNGTVTVTNKATGSIIFSGPLKDLASGTFYPENMPAVSGGATACTYTYSDWGVCQSDSTQIRTYDDVDPLGLYRDTGPVTGLHLFTANSVGLYLQLLRLGCLPVEQHANQNGNIVSCGLYRDTGTVAGLHLGAACNDLQLVHVLCLGRLH